MIQVTIYRLNNNADDERVGTIAWDGHAIALDPADSPLLTRILHDDDSPAVFDPDTGRGVTAKDDPALWLANLHRAYTSPYLRASRLEESPGRTRKK